MQVCHRRFAPRHGMRRLVPSLSMALLIAVTAQSAHAAGLDAKRIAAASGEIAAITPDGVVHLGWTRSDVKVNVDGVPLPPAAGLGSWAAFAPMPHGRAMVMGDTVVFQDEVDAAMDAAFAHGLAVTALHNHFFYDRPKVYFMHIGGEGTPESLAAGVKAVWTAIRAVRSAHPQPATGFGGVAPMFGHIDAAAVGTIVGQPVTDLQGVVKVTIGREGRMYGMRIGGSMGLVTWAAFSGSNQAAVMDGDFIMTTAQVQPVLHALRKAGIHIVALHNHMMGGNPGFFFTHFWGKGITVNLAQGLRSALDAEAAVKQP